MKIIILIIILILSSLSPHRVFGASLLLDTLASEAVGRPVEYAVLLPPAREAPYPLVLLLHGAGGDREYLNLEAAVITELWEAGSLPEFVIATASVPPGTIYMDDRAGKAKWETFMMEEFLPHLRATYPVSARRSETLITGVSMGGAGTVRRAVR